MFCKIEKYYTSQILYGYGRKGEYKRKKQCAQKVATVKLWTFLQDCIFKNNFKFKNLMMLQPNQKVMFIFSV